MQLPLQMMPADAVQIGDSNLSYVVRNGKVEYNAFYGTDLQPFRV